MESHNVAVGGRPVSECLRLYSKLVERLFDASMGHNLIVFHAGDNDIGQGRDAVQTYAAFTDYVTAAHRQGWKVVVSTELRRPDFDPSKQVQLDDYNNRLRRNEAAADAVVELDLDTRMPDLAIRKDAEIFSHDRIHPNDGGYAILASMLVPAVKQLVGR